MQEALKAGGKALCGATREGTLFQPTVLVDVPWGEKVTCEEVFAPVVVIQSVSDIDEAIELSNATPYGLQTGIYTQDIATAFKFADAVEQGGININETCWWRVDFQPYGGVKNSGVGREGIKAITVLSREGIKVNATVCFSPNQALLAAKAGATYISPFVGRLDTVGHDGMILAEEILQIYRNYDFATQVILAAARHPLHIVQAALMGAHITTMSFDILEQMFHHPLTDVGVEQFLADWNEAGLSL